MRYVIENEYIDISVLEGGVPGIPGCTGQSGVVLQLLRDTKEGKGDLSVWWLDQANVYGSVLHKLIEEALKRYHIASIVLWERSQWRA